MIGSSGFVTELKVCCDKLESVARPKAFIQWVSHPVSCKVRLYNRLFKHAHPEDPTEVPGGFLSDCNRDALHVISNAVVDVSVSKCQAGDRFQFERIGYFTPHYDSTPEKLIFNCTVRLREDTSK
ncbi:glutamine--tRNA ligase-like [Corticium candelabrum]|uniref:glutamine--tRNA ligase-like n=1 Tax=Corticium candelabrum TaxID=121492 RepID=UPI002E25F780|nr:glutamine--tRNA ligase-like [Corticium candelabrum]